MHSPNYLMSHGPDPKRYVLFLFALLLISLIPAFARISDENSSSTQARGLVKFTDVGGKSYSLQASPERMALVLIFVTTDCPIANSYQPMLARLHKEFHCFQSRVQPYRQRVRRLGSAWPKRRNIYMNQ